MCPEYGATVAIFPIDEMTLDYLRLTGRDESRVAAGRGVRAGAGTLPPRRRAGRGVFGHGRARAWARSSRASPGRSGRRIAWRCTTPRPRSRWRCRRCRWRRSRRRRRCGRRAPGRRDGDRRGRAVGRGGGRPGARRARSRRGGDCRDHELHEHVESERDDRRRPRGQEGGRARPHAQAVGEEQPRARIEGRDGISRRRRALAVSRSARIQPGRLRLHDLHRQQRSAARRSLRGHSRQEPRRLLGAERQPQLRGTHPAGRARQLPGVAAARRRLRAGGMDHERPHDRAARRRSVGQAGVSERHLADRAGAAGDDAARRARRDVPEQLSRRLQGRQALAVAARARGQPVRVGRTTPPTSASRRSSKA